MKADIAGDLRGFLKASYPDMDVRAEPWPDDPSRLAIYFTDPKFALIYPQQRFHYLSHLIPAAYQETQLKDSIWFELAPGESPEDLRYPDAELIVEITPDVMKCVWRARVFDALDDALCPRDPSAPRSLCWGDYRNARPILLARGFVEDELFDVFHVLMAQGGHCDCEILFNVAEGSRFAAECRTKRQHGGGPAQRHGGA
jgi:hypothetical protein